MTTSPRLSLPYLAPQQAQKHVTVNESVRRLDALVGLAAVSRSLTAEPASPAEGDAYIIPAAATGDAWGAFAEDSIAAFQDGAWTEIAPREGLRAWIGDEDALAVYNGAAWTGIGGGGSGESAPKFGVNTSADTTNRLAVKADAALFHHDDVTPGSGDMRIVCNKADAGGTASFMFQTGDSGRAEFGLTGADDFTLKVSADGAAWKNALVIDKDTGEATAQTHFSIVRAIPSTFWSAIPDQSAHWLPYGYFGTNGAYGLGLWYNGYRNNAAGWTSQAINGSAVGAGIELQAGGCYIRHENAPAGASPAIRVAIDASALAPGADNALSCGSSSKRWSQVYAASGTINTSDARDKVIEGALTEAEKRAARRLLAGIVKYRWKDSLARKGESARVHIGVTAQQVREAFAAEGLDATQYGLWCEDAVSELVDDPDHGVFERATGETRLGVRYDELFAFALASLAG